MSARDELETMAYTDQADTRIWALSEVRDALNTYRAEVLSGNEANPSPVVLDAQAYRWLADEISKTMVDSDRWDGDEGEDEILARYVRWLAAERTSADAEVLERAADAVADQSPGGECDCYTSTAALLRAMATAGKASSPEPTATRERTITHTWPGETPFLTVRLTFGDDWTDAGVDEVTNRVQAAARYGFTETPVDQVVMEPEDEPHGSMEDVFTASELHEMGQDAEYRMDAEDEARDAERGDDA